MKALLPLLCTLFLCFELKAQVEPPNYNFSLDQLERFMPGSSVEELITQEGPGEEVKLQQTKANIRQYYVAHIRYKFPVFIQIENNQIIDMFARLPSYFLHDIFHQSLINRHERQDRYHNQNEHSVYQWTSEDNLVRTYAGACTITCFPIYYTVSLKELRTPTLLNLLNQAPN